MKKIFLSLLCVASISLHAVPTLDELLKQRPDKTILEHLAKQAQKNSDAAFQKAVKEKKIQEDPGSLKLIVPKVSVENCLQQALEYAVLHEQIKEYLEENDK